jgi:RecB family exonuclease
MTYLDRPAPQKGPPWAHNTVGSVVHLALARWWQLPAEQRTPEAGASLVKRNWQSDGFADSAQSEAWRDQAADWVESYLTDEQQRGRSEDNEPRGVERTVATRTSLLSISGRVDRIDERNGELVIVDYKTGRSRLGSDDVRGSLALALYAVAAERTLRRRCRQVELHHIPTGDVVAFEHTDASLTQHLDRAGEIATDIVAAIDTLGSGADPDDVFPANPGPVCSWCDFRRLCPEGQLVSPVKNGWAGLGVLIADQP